MKKGQGALEYLMTYGWALLVIVVVGAALFALGVLNPSTYTQSRCTGLQYFTFQDQKLTASAYSIDLINGPRDVVIVGLTVNGEAYTGISPTTVAAGSRFVLSGTNNTALPKVVGNSFSYLVTIKYNVTGGISGNTDAGTCTGKIA